MIEISDSTWETLCDIVRPYMEAEGEIEEVGISFESKRSGLTATVTKPVVGVDVDWTGDSDEETEGDTDEEIPEPPFETELEDIDEEDIPRNGEVTFYEPPAPQIRQAMVADLLDHVRQTPPAVSIGIRRIIVTEEGINTYYELRRAGMDTGSNSLYETLAEALHEEEYLDSPDNFGGGTLNMYEQSEEFRFSGEGKYRVDGTLYRLTEEPYKYWSAGPDEDYPTDIEEWAEFASDNEVDKKRQLEKDQYRIHFHPSGFGVGESNSLVGFFRTAEDEFFKGVEFTSSVEDEGLGEVFVGDGVYYMTGGFKIDSDRRVELPSE